MAEQLTDSQVAELMDLLDSGSGMFGPLSPRVRARLAAVANEPSQITWDDAYSILIGPSLTLWQALLDHTDYAVTRRGTNSIWPEVPATEQILLALRTELS